jgi:diguanylate cyclase (GGDEF)-like protein
MLLLPAAVEELVLAVNPIMLAFAIVATLVTAGLLFVTLLGSRSGSDQARLREDRRRSSHADGRDPREALALVGDALAATHNPRVLLPVILDVITEATDARGGQIYMGEQEVGWVGTVGDPEVETLTLPLGSSPEGETVLLLHAPDSGFGKERRDLAEWLASQASVALENARLHDVVQRQAITDDLTDLVNRRRFMDGLGAEIERARRFGSPLSVVLADLDDFKRINDEWGHHAGDDVLRSFADLVRSHVRDVDVPARIGGEEFAILLPETDAADAARVAERMRHSLSVVPVPVGDNATVQVTCSFGVAELRGQQSGDDVMRAADAALYVAKGRGKNRVETSKNPI